MDPAAPNFEEGPPLSVDLSLERPEPLRDLLLADPSEIFLSVRDFRRLAPSLSALGRLDLDSLRRRGFLPALPPVRGRDKGRVRIVICICIEDI
jgi:hypothetical protein